MYITCFSKGLSAIDLAVDKNLLPHKTLAFIPTAGDTYENPYFVEESRQRLSKHGLKLVELNVRQEENQDLVEKLEGCDGIFVAGGNTFYLLQQLVAKDLLDTIKEKVRGGMPYFGESARGGASSRVYR